MVVSCPQGGRRDCRRGADLRLAGTHRIGLTLLDRCVGDRDRRPGDCGGGSPPSRPRRVAVDPQWRLVHLVRSLRHRLAWRRSTHAAVDDWSVCDRLWGRALGPSLSPTQSSRAPDVGGQGSMTDLERLGLALVGFALAVVVGGVLLGLVGAWITKSRGGGAIDNPRSASL